MAIRIPKIKGATALIFVLVPSLVRSRSGELVYSLTAGDFPAHRRWNFTKLTLEKDTGGEPLALVVAIGIGGGLQ